MERLLHRGEGTVNTNQWVINSRRVAVKPLQPLQFLCLFSKSFPGWAYLYDARKYTEAIVYWQVNNIILNLKHHGYTGCLASHNQHASTLYTHTNAQLRTCAIKTYLPVIWFRLGIFTFCSKVVCAVALRTFIMVTSAEGAE